MTTIIDLINALNGLEWPGAFAFAAIVFAIAWMIVRN